MNNTILYFHYRLMYLFLHNSVNMWVPYNVLPHLINTVWYVLSYNYVCIYVYSLAQYLRLLKGLKLPRVYKVVLVINNDNFDYLHLNARYSADLYSMLTKSRKRNYCFSRYQMSLYFHAKWPSPLEIQYFCCSKPFLKFKCSLSAVFIQETNENVGSTLIVFLHMKFC